jgi:hypothetical protein
MSSVSVFIPCYKYAHFLRDCVQSVLRQDGVDVRVLILDDCSPDDTPEVARRLMAEDRRVEYHRNRTNRGHIATYNIGIEWAAGDYCLLLSADDMLTPHALARAARVMDGHPDVSLTYGGEIRTAEPRFDAVSARAHADSRVIAGREFWELSCREAKNLVPTPTAVVRTSVQKRVGGYRHDLPHSGDLEMWLRLAANGSVGIVDAVQGLYRTHGRNMSTAFRDLRDIQEKKAAFDVAGATCGAILPGAARLLALADRRLAEEAFWLGSRLFEAGESAASRECLDCALQICPALREWASWRRLRVKQMLGPALWGVVRPLRDWARGRRPAAGPVTA